MPVPVEVVVAAGVAMEAKVVALTQEEEVMGAKEVCTILTSIVIVIARI